MMIEAAGRCMNASLNIPNVSRTVVHLGTVPFRVTINLLMQYNSIAFKVLTELVLALANLD